MLDILLSILMIIIFFLILKEVVAVISINTKMNAIKKNNKRAEMTIDSLKREEYKLKNDTFYIEKIAREQFGMARRGEKVYIFIKPRKKNFFQNLIHSIKKH